MMYPSWLFLAGYSSYVPWLEFRDATIDDKDEVLSLRTNVYRGLDYLPDYYDFFLKDPNRKCFVGYIGGEMVAFGVMLTMDGGQSVLGQAGRVKENHEGQGIFSSLTDYMNSLARQSRCQRRVALVETTLNKYARSERFRKVHREIESKMHYAGVVDQEAKSKFKNLNHVDSDVISAADKDDLHRYITCEHHARYLFPKNTILLDYVPLKTISENMKHFGGRSNAFFSSVSSTNGNIDGLLSAGSSFSCKNPPKSYTIDIYGNIAEDLETHFTFHLIRASTLLKEPFCLQIFVERGFIAQRLCKILMKYRIPKCNWYVDGGVSIKTTVEEVFD